MKSIENIKLGFLIASCFCWNSMLFSQEKGAFLDWVIQTEGSGGLLGQWVFDVAVDIEKNIYLFGGFRGEVIFGKNTDNETVLSEINSLGSPTKYLAKYSSEGEFAWVLPFYDFESPDFKLLILNDNLYLVGVSSKDSVQLNLNSSGPKTYVGANSVFLSRFTLDGDFISAVPLCKSSGVNILLNAEINNLTQTVNVCGRFTFNMNFDLSPNSDYPVGGSYAYDYVANYDFNGNLNWVRYLDNSNLVGERRFSDIATDNLGNTYWTGHFRDTAWLTDQENFSPLVSQQVSSMHNDIFIVKYDHSGNAIWQSQISAPIDKFITQRKLIFHNSELFFSTISNDSVYFKYFYDGNWETEVSSSSPEFKHSIFKFNPLDGKKISRMTFFNSQLFGFSTFTLNEDNQIYLAGSISPFNGVVDFNPDMEKEFLREATASQGEFYLAKYDSDGSFIWAFSGSGDNNSASRFITLIDENEPLLIGSLRGQIDVSGYAPPKIITTHGMPSLNPHSFIAKYSEGFLNTQEANLSNSEMVVFPNPSQNTNTLVFNKTPTAHTTIDLYDFQGRLIQPVFKGDISAGMEITVDLSGLSSGMYLYRITNNHSQQAIKFVKE
jgi:hypothetical protein